jgi:hypothetical protein
MNRPVQTVQTYPQIAISLTLALTLVSCGTSSSQHSNDAGNTTDRNSFRNDQSAAPRVNNAPIDP